MNSRILEEEVIISKIFQLRGKKVMLSHDLAELYRVETKVLNQQVKRNIAKFPDRYMFQLTKDEFDTLRSQFVTLERGRHPKYLPFAFTEHGVLMLSSVLNSEWANKVSLHIIDTFVKIRKLLYMHKDVIQQLELVHNKLSSQDSQIKVIFEYLQQLEKEKQDVKEFKNRPKVGFKISK